MKSLLPLIAAIPLVVIFGIAEGRWTERWQPSPDRQQAIARIANVPQILGDWQGKDDELDARQVALARLDSYIVRRYLNRRSGEWVSVMLVCGRPGPIAAHTPEICFPGGGSEMKVAPHRQEFKMKGPPARAEFWAARFDSQGPAGPESSNALWAWTADGNWSASEQPRIDFARSPSLYKLYVIRPVLKGDVKPADDRALVEFLNAFLPATQAALFPER